MRLLRCGMKSKKVGLNMFTERKDLVARKRPVCHWKVRPNLFQMTPNW